MGGDNVDDSVAEESDRSNPMLREQDRFLPIANVARIMKKTIPRTGKVLHILIEGQQQHAGLITLFTDCERCSRMCPGVCFRVHQFHNE